MSDTPNSKPTPNEYRFSSSDPLDLDEGKRLLDAMKPGEWYIDQALSDAFALRIRARNAPYSAYEVAVLDHQPEGEDFAAGIVWLRNNAAALLARVEEAETEVIENQQMMLRLAAREAAHAVEAEAEARAAIVRGDQWKDTALAAEARCAALTGEVNRWCKLATEASMRVVDLTHALRQVVDLVERGDGVPDYITTMDSARALLDPKETS